MTLREILARQGARWRRPGPWAVLLAWTLLSAIPPVLQAGRSFTPSAWVLWLLCQALTYGSLAWLGPWPWLWTPQEAGYPSLGAALLRSLVLGGIALLAVSLPESLRHVVSNGASLGPQLQTELTENAVVYLATFILAGWGLGALEREAAGRAEAERREKEAQWTILRGQLSPHVLFNGMNNLARLVCKDPERAERAAEDLAELFRRLMDHAHRHLSPLREERELVERYLRLEALRFGPRLAVAWAWDPALDAVEAPPFLLQPLVENALKHGLGPCPEGGRLQVAGRLEHGRVHLAVTNTGRPFSGRGPVGLGLPNLEARLALAFQEAGSFRLEATPEGTLAQVSFPRLEAL